MPVLHQIACGDALASSGNLDRTKCGFKAGQLVTGAEHIVVASQSDDVYVFATQLGGRGAFMLAHDRIPPDKIRGDSCSTNARAGRA